MAEIDWDIFELQSSAALLDKVESIMIAVYCGDNSNVFNVLGEINTVF